MPKKKPIDNAAAPGVPWIAVDPGAHTAVAVFTPAKARPHFTKVTSFRTREGPWIMRMKSIVMRFDTFLSEIRCGAMFIEEPKAFTSVATHKGDQMKIDAIYGMLCAVGFLRGMLVVPVPVNEWKGQLTKAMTEKRTLDLIGWDAANHTEHEFDAMGIAIYVNKQWNKENNNAR